MKLALLQMTAGIDPHANAQVLVEAIEQAAAVALLTHAFVATEPDSVTRVAIDIDAERLHLTLTGPAMGQAGRRAGRAFADGLPVAAPVTDQHLLARLETQAGPALFARITVFSPRRWH